VSGNRGKSEGGGNAKKRSNSRIKAALLGGKGKPQKSRRRNLDGGLYESLCEKEESRVYSGIKEKKKRGGNAEKGLVGLERGYRASLPSKKEKGNAREPQPRPFWTIERGKGNENEKAVSGSICKIAKRKGVPGAELKRIFKLFRGEEILFSKGRRSTARGERVEKKKESAKDCRRVIAGPGGGKKCQGKG